MKQYNIRFNEEEEFELLEELEKFKNKNKVFKDALGLYFVLREEFDSDNPLKIFQKIVLSSPVNNNKSDRGTEQLMVDQSEEDVDDYIDLDIGQLDSVLSSIK